MINVFVYGTLRQGQYNSYLLEGANYIGEYHTTADYRMHSLGPFPAITKNGDTAIVGELYEVNDDTLKLLDRLEGHPEFYHRDVINIPEWEDKVVIAYYLDEIQASKYPIVPNGDWLK